MTERDEALTIGTVCKILRCGPSNVYKLIDAGELRGFRIGVGRGGKRVHRSDLDDFIQRRKSEFMQ